MAWRPGQPLPGSVLEAARQIELLMGLEDDRWQQPDAGRAPAAAARSPASAGRIGGMGGLLNAIIASTVGPRHSGPIPGSGAAPFYVHHDPHRRMCTDKYVDCVQERWPGDWNCGKCLDYCTGINKKWPDDHCARDWRPPKSAPRYVQPPIPAAPRPRRRGGGRFFAVGPGAWGPKWRPDRGVPLPLFP